VIRVWRTPAKQDRSHASERRLVDAALQMLETVDAEDLSMAAVAKRAGMSVGGLYARFADKAALVNAVDERLLQEMSEVLRSTMSETRLLGLSSSEVVRVYVRMMLRYFASRRGVLRQVAVKVRTSDEPDRVQRWREFNQEAHGRLARSLIERGGIHHEEPEAAIAFGILFVSAAAREAVLFGDRKLNLSTVRGRKLAAELCRAFLAYLGIRESR